VPDPTVASPSRALRAGSGAAVAVVVAAGAHAAGRGGVDLQSAAWTFLALIGPAWWAAGRRRGWGALVVSQLAGQQLAHLILSTTGPAGHVLPIDVMLYAHLLGAALSATWLLWGERRAWTAARRWIAGVLDAPGRVPDPPPPTRTDAAAPGGRCGDVLRHALVRRGPPRALLAV
jgi:hypothetical protein